MKRQMGTTAAKGRARNFDAVPRELAPLARALEREASSPRDPLEKMRRLASVPRHEESAPTVLRLRVQGAGSGTPLCAEANPLEGPKGEES
jgi:hypothetical protein